MVEKEILKKMRFLGELSDSVIEKIGSIATLENYDEHSIVFEQNQDLSHLYMMVSGKVHFTVESASGKALTLDKIYEGRTFGVSALMEESSSAYTAICVENSSIVSIPGKQMRQLFEEDFKIGHILMLNVVKLFKKRIERHTRQFLLSLATHSEIK
ncbi:MAG: cyclic nucleotide-binding domain-containing protein [Desulfobacteraceae bacterium]|nr:cyclic nucleotide-binding domain-containing protein [Desulfobacteraceae bacterium]